MYKPEFKCEFCGRALEVGMVSPDQGYMGTCSCPEFRKSWERKHYEDIERKKQWRRKKNR